MQILKANDELLWRYNKSVDLYSVSQTISVQRGCFCYMFTNVGGTLAFVDGMRIFPAVNPATTLGDSRTICGHKGDIYSGFINLAFDPTVFPLVNPLVEIVQEFYILQD